MSYALSVALTTGLAVVGVGADTLHVPKFDWSFDRPLVAYSPVNLRDALDLEIVELDGESCFRVENRRMKRVPHKRDNGTVAMREYDTLFSISSERFPVEPSKFYALKIRARGILRMQHPRPSPCIEWFDANGRPLLTRDAWGKDVPFVSDFTFDVSAKSWRTTIIRGAVPEKAAYAVIRIGCDQPNVEIGNWLAISRVSYYEKERKEDLNFGDCSAPTVKRLTPSPCTNLNAAVSMRVFDASGVNWSTFTCKLDGVDVTSRISREGDVATFHPDSPWKPESFHEFVISCADGRGNFGEESCFICFVGSGVAHPTISLRDDGMPLVDGCAFFPIAISSVRPCPENGQDVEVGVRELKENGFNLVGTYAIRNARKKGDYEDIADACERHGMFLRLEPGPRTGTNREKIICENLLEGRARRCLFCWQIGDDTSLHITPEELRRDYLICKAVDGRVLTGQADICHFPGSFAPYAPYADCFRVENYPIYAPSPRNDEMPTLVRDMSFAYADLISSGAKPRCIESIVQAFMGWDMVKRFPTRDELRAMTILSVAMRSRGISYYTYWSPNGQGAASSREWLDRLYSVTRELAAISGDLSSRDAEIQPRAVIVSGPKTDALGQFPVSFLLKETGLLLAASSASDPLCIEFTLPYGRKISRTILRNGVIIERVGESAANGEAGLGNDHSGWDKNWL